MERSLQLRPVGGQRPGRCPLVEPDGARAICDVMGRRSAHTRQGGRINVQAVPACPTARLRLTQVDGRPNFTLLQTPVRPLSGSTTRQRPTASPTFAAGDDESVITRNHCGGDRGRVCRQRLRVRRTLQPLGSAVSLGVTMLRADRLYAGWLPTACQRVTTHRIRGDRHLVGLRLARPVSVYAI